MLDFNDAPENDDQPTAENMAPDSENDNETTQSGDNAATE